MAEYLTAKDAASYLKMSERTLADYRLRTKGPTYQKANNGRVRYDKTALDRWKLDRGTVWTDVGAVPVDPPRTVRPPKTRVPTNPDGTYKDYNDHFQAYMNGETGIAPRHEDYPGPNMPNFTLPPRT